jgi:hypothetical protein
MWVQSCRHSNRDGWLLGREHYVRGWNPGLHRQRTVAICGHDVGENRYSGPLKGHGRCKQCEYIQSQIEAASRQTEEG